jgi:predicted nucleic acid-binding protein
VPSVVIDASALMAVLLGESNRDVIVQTTRGIEMVSSACLPWEMGNALSALMKRKRLGLREATRIYAEFGTISIRFIDANFNEALAIADACGLYAYDAYYLDCARRLRLPLLTLDASMRVAAANVDVDLLEVS